MKEGHKLKIPYEIPYLEIIELELQDIITTSGAVDEDEDDF